VPLYENMAVEWIEHHPTVAFFYAKNDTLLEALVLDDSIPNKDGLPVKFFDNIPREFITKLDESSESLYPPFVMSGRNEPGKPPRQPPRIGGLIDHDRLKMWQVAKDHGLLVKMRKGAEHMMEVYPAPLPVAPEGQMPEGEGVHRERMRESASRMKQMVKDSFDVYFEEETTAELLRSRHRELETLRIKAEL